MDENSSGAPPSSGVWRWIGRHAAIVTVGLTGLAACGHAVPDSAGGSPTSRPLLTAQAIDPGDNTLSNEPFVAVTNGWGPVERNRSNGETGAADGRPITVDGTVYATGFGVHAASSMTFNVQGRCRTLTGTVGIDDEVGSRGSVVFQVFGDGVRLFDSGVLTGASPARAISVDITNRTELRLAVTDGGDGGSYDHADWAGTMLRACGAAPATVAPAPVVRLNAGGAAQTVDGVTWAACADVAACQGYVRGGFAYTPAVPPAIANPAPPANATVLQSEWTGGESQGIPAGASAFSFRIPVVNGPYQVRLQFAELSKTASGQRVFDVRLENATVLSSFDVFQAAGGAARSVVRSFDVTVQDGAVDLDFIRGVENATVSAVEILPRTVAWTARTPAPSTLYEAQGAAVNGRLHVFGGFYTNLNGTKPAATRGAWVYDPATDRWATRREMPEALTHAGTAVDGAAIYVAGGFLGNHPGPQTAHVWRYDTVLDTWTAMPPLPAARGAGALVRLNRRLHYFGGTERSATGAYIRDTPEHWVLDLDAPTRWMPRAPLPRARNHLAGVVLGGLIYAVGGQSLGNEAYGNVTNVDRYDPSTDRWTAVAPLPMPLGHITASTVAWQQRLVTVGGVTTARTGGQNEGAESGAVLSYDPAANRWSARSALPAVRQSPVADVIADQLIVTTGATSSGPVDTTWLGR